MERLIKNYHILVLGIAIISLASAYIAEYGFGLKPCPLCIYQRYPFFALIPLALFSWYKQNLFGYWPYLIIFAAATILAGYHSGVERGIFELASFCQNSMYIPDDTTVADFINMLEDKEPASCDKPTVIVAGISMANFNLLLNFKLFVTTLVLKLRKKHHA